MAKLWKDWGGTSDWLVSGPAESRETRGSEVGKEMALAANCAFSRRTVSECASPAFSSSQRALKPRAWEEQVGEALATARPGGWRVQFLLGPFSWMSASKDDPRKAVGGREFYVVVQTLKLL